MLWFHASVYGALYPITLLLVKGHFVMVIFFYNRCLARVAFLPVEGPPLDDLDPFCYTLKILSKFHGPLEFYETWKAVFSYKTRFSLNSSLKKNMFKLNTVLAPLHSMAVKRVYSSTMF